MAKIVKIVKRDLLDADGKIIGDYVAPVLDNGEEIEGLLVTDFSSGNENTFGSNTLTFLGRPDVSDERSCQE